jgi:DNA-binding XRE family transcriptional regulator
MPETEPKQVLTPRMIRAARALLGLEQSDLAELAEVSRKTIVNVEADPNNSDRLDSRRRDVFDAIQTTFEVFFDVEFVFPDSTTGEGVRLRKRRSRLQG